MEQAAGLWCPAVADGFEARWFGTYGVVAAPRGASHLRLEGTEFAFTTALDGTRTREGLIEEFGEDAEDWLDTLWEEGFLEGSPQPDGRRVVTTRQGIEVSGFDRVATRLHRWVGPVLFSRPAAATMAVVAVAGLVMFVDALLSGASMRPVALSALLTVVIIEVLDWAAFAVHELAHALATKWAGRRVGRFGVGFYWGELSVYVDASDTMMADRPKRIVQAAAGCIADLVLAGIALIAAAAIGSDTTAAELLRLFAVLRYLTVALNLVPLLELDGYWILADVLDQPDRRSKATAALRDAPRALRDPARRHLALYGAASTAFGVLLIASSVAVWWNVFADLVGSLLAGNLVDKAVGVYFVLPYLVMVVHLVINAVRSVRSSRAEPAV
jgi:putative peptide zinc metalloprotease protein